MQKNMSLEYEAPTGKFKIDLKADPDFPRKVVQSFMEGICWTLAYYYRGCPSWDW